MAGLDGFRGAAVIAVLLFHGGFGWAQGGFLGVTSFFVLSGFLITSLLLLERSGSGRIDLRGFWARRARRLVPAGLLTIGLVIAYVALAAPAVAGRVAGDGVASAFWVANWRLILTGHSYADLFSDPSPFQHMWSLAIEEQFYLVLPPAVVLLLRGRGRGLLAAVVGACVLASTAAAWAWGPGARGYYGTDARVAEPLVGVLLALALVGRDGVKPLRRRGVVLGDVAAVVSLAGLVYLIASWDDRAAVVYRGGFLSAAVLSAVVVAAATQPGSMVGRVLAVPPLAAIGKISYGVYLFHWPVFLWLNAARTGLAPVPLFLMRCAATLVLASVSYIVVERPVRLGRLPRRVAPVAWANASVGLLAGLMLATAVAPSPSSSLFASAADDADEAPPLPDVVDEAPATTTAGAGPVATSTTAAVRTGGQPAGSRPGPPRKNGAPGGKRPSPVFDTPNDPTPPPSPQPPANGGTPRKPTRLKIAVVGDSMGLSLGKGLQAWADDRGDVAVYRLAISGCPISRGGTRWVDEPGDAPVQPVCNWWTEDDSQRWKALVAFGPDIVVMQDGLNAIWTRYQEHWGEYRSLADPRFDQWLLDEYRVAIARFHSLGATTLFLNGACVNWPHIPGAYDKYRDGRGEWMVNHYNQVMAMLSTWTWTANFFEHICPNGQFTNTVDGVENARPDHYHLTPEASKAIATTWLGPIVLQAMPPEPESVGTQPQP